MNKDRLGESMERVVVNDIFWKSCQSAVHRLQGLLLPIQIKTKTNPVYIVQCRWSKDILFKAFRDMEHLLLRHNFRIFLLKLVVE